MLVLEKEVNRKKKKYFGDKGRYQNNGCGEHLILNTKISSSSMYLIVNVTL